MGVMVMASVAGLISVVVFEADTEKLVVEEA